MMGKCYGRFTVFRYQNDGLIHVKQDARELLGSDTNFAAVHRTAPSGRAIGLANLGSDPKNSWAQWDNRGLCILKPY